MPVEGSSYPVNLLLSGRRVLVVGGGRVALEKVRGLLAAGALVDVVAPEVIPELRALDVTIAERTYMRGELDRYWFVVACTDDPTVNQQVFEDGEEARIWVNAADDPARCSATLPARLDRGDLLVTVSTAGRSPAFAAWLRDQLAEHLGPEHEELLELLATTRADLLAAGRRHPPASWRRALDSGMLDLIRTGRSDEARALLLSSLDSASAPPGSR